MQEGNINKYIENIRRKKIKFSAKKIKNIVYKYLRQRQYDSNVEVYYTPKIYYKKYYPLCHRKFYISLTSQKKNLERYVDIIKIIINYENNPKNILTTTFNTIIDLLTDDELVDIGW